MARITFLLISLSIFCTDRLYAQKESPEVKALHTLISYLELDEVQADSIAAWSQLLAVAENAQSSYDERLDSWTHLLNSIAREMGASPPSSYQASSAVAYDLKITSWAQDFNQLKSKKSGLGAVSKKGNGGQAILFIPPLGFSGFIYESLAEELSKDFTTYQVTLAGFGGTEPLNLPEKRRLSEKKWLENSIDGLVQLINRERGKDFFFFVTGQFSYLAFEVADRLPDRVKGIILNNAQVRNIMLSRINRGEKVQMEERLERVNRSFPNEILSPSGNVIRFGYNQQILFDQEPANSLIQKANEGTNYQIANRYAGEIAATDVEIHLKDLDFPVLAINSVLDEKSALFGNDINWMQWQEMRHKFPNKAIHLVTLPDTRHFLFMEEEEKVTALVKDFVRAPKAFHASPGEIEGSKLITSSPKAELSQTFGSTTMTIFYHRPGVKGREIFGKLVPYGQVWRAGANRATEFSFNNDVLINGKRLKAGRYSFFVIPNEEKWVLIFNKIIGIPNPFFYNEDFDVLRWEVDPEELSTPQEWLKYDVESIENDRITVALKWDGQKVSFEVEEPFESPEPPARIASANWKRLIEDPEGDGRIASFSDGKALYYFYDRSTDSLWFRFDHYNEVNINAAAMNLLFDTDDDQQTGFNWFGTNTEFTFDLMVTMWLNRRGNGYTGIVGMTDAEGAKTQYWTSLSQDNLRYYISDADNAYYVGMKKSDVTKNGKILKVIGAVGNGLVWNDDVGENGAHGVISLE